MATRTVTIALIVDSKGVVKGVKTAGGAFVKLDKNIEKVGKSTSKLNTIFKGVAFGLIARKAVQVTERLFELASGAAETASKFETTFGNMADDVDAFGESFANMAGLTQTEFRDLASVSGAILLGMGANMNEVVDDTTRILKLAGDIASFHEVSIGEAFNAIRSGLVGQSEPLQRYGILLDAVSTKVRALRDTGKENEKQLTQLEKAQARLNLMYERANVSIGDLERTQDSAANTAKRLAARLREQVEEFAIRLLPTMELALKRVDELFTENEETIDEWGESVADAISGIAQLIIITADLIAKFDALTEKAKQSSFVWRSLVALWKGTQILNPAVQIELLTDVLDRFNRSSEGTNIRQESMNMLFSGFAHEIETNTSALGDNTDATDTNTDGKKKQKTITEQLNEEIKKLTFNLTDLKGAEEAELLVLMRRTDELARQLQFEQERLRALSVPQELEPRGTLAELTTIGKTPAEILAEELDAQHRKLEAQAEIIKSNERLAESEKLKAKVTIAAAAQMGAAQANVLKSVIAVVRQHIQAKFAEAVANSVAAGSVLGPIAGAIAGALMMIIFSKLMGDVGGPATEGISGVGGGSIPRASDRAASLGGLRIQNRGLTQGAVGAPAGGVASTQEIGVRIEVIEPDMFTLETAVTQAKDIRNKVGNTTG